MANEKYLYKVKCYNCGKPFGYLLFRFQVPNNNDEGAINEITTQMKSNAVARFICEYCYNKLT